MAGNPQSLRRSLAIIAIAFVVSSIVVSASLIVATTQLHRTSEVLASELESVRLAQAAEIRLLLHLRSDDPRMRQANAEELRERLASAQDLVTTEREARALRDAVAQVDAYLAGDARPDRQEAAFAALRTLVEVNIQQAKSAIARSERLDMVANVVGVSIAVVVVGLTLWLVWWSRRNLFRPILALATTMDRFGRGDRDVRAIEHGPREIQDMQARFNDMAAALAEQRRTLTASLGGIAHDLRNPLTALRFAVATMDPSQPLPDEERIRAVIARIDRQITRIDRMITDLLDTAKIEAGQLELEPRPVDLAELARSVADLFESSSPAHTIAVRVPDERVTVECDPVRIEQVLVNLVSNAIKYSPGGGEVGIAVAARADAVTVSVSDEGIGIAAEARRDLFAPFQRGRRETREIPGVGLGLYGARRIVELHGGRIEVESAAGRGSTFHVHLPRIASGRAADMPESPVDAPRPGAALPADARLRS